MKGCYNVLMYATSPHVAMNPMKTQQSTACRSIVSYLSLLMLYFICLVSGDLLLFQHRWYASGRHEPHGDQAVRLVFRVGVDRAVWHVPGQ